MAIQRMRTTFRDVAPCQDCTERFPACHGDCPKDKRGEFGYAAWKQAAAEVEKKRKLYYDILDTCCKHRRNRFHGKGK